MANAETTLFRTLVRRGAAVVTIAALAASSVWAQQAKQQPSKTESLESRLQEEVQIPQSPASTVALEAPVNPDHYYVGPSDVIAVNVWMSPPLSLSLPVTPEGTLIIPTVGEVRVADRTLSEAKREIVREVRKKYSLPEVTATLVKPRPIVVSVAGNVLNPGLYTMTGVDRANKLINEANKPTRLQTAWEVSLVKKTQSLRSILLKHRDGSTSRVDLPKYFAAQADSLNPYLREGDLVVVPQRDPMKNVFGVYGQVNAPGRYEFVEGDRVLDAVRIAQGATALGVAEKAIFSRLSPDGSTLSTRMIDIPAIAAGTAENFSLEPGDRIVVQGRNDLREDFNVDVKGEVRFPATYPITGHGTRLSEVIRLAGGFTEDADLASATVTRRTYAQEEVSAEELISQRGMVATGDTLGYTLENSLRINREAVTVDFSRLFEQGDSTQDVVLRAEDEIYIGKKPHTVYVFGQVASPGHITFSGGKSVDYYVQRAGGFTGRASRSEIRVVKAKTKQWLSPDDATLEPGDFVWVPAEPDRQFSYYMTVASQAAAVLSVVIGVAVLVIQASN